jgi:molecular chaperone DnaK (HSP70)
VISLKDRHIDLWELYTRTQFEQDIRAHQQQIEQVLVETLHSSGLEPGQIDAVVKTGGSSNIPAFTRMLARHFDPGRIQASDAFSSVTAGLALS